MGAKAIAEALKINQSVKLIQLEFNSNIGVEGAKALAEMLKINETLEHLTLYGCDFTDAGIKVLFEAVHENHFLTHLWVLEEQPKEIEEKLQQNVNRIAARKIAKKELVCTLLAYEHHAFELAQAKLAKAQEEKKEEKKNEGKGDEEKKTQEEKPVQVRPEAPQNIHKHFYYGELNESNLFSVVDEILCGRVSRKR